MATRKNLHSYQAGLNILVYVEKPQKYQGLTLAANICVGHHASLFQKGGKKFFKPKYETM